MTVSDLAGRLPEAKAALESFLAEAAAAAGCRIVDMTPLWGGSVQETWRLAVDFDGGAEAGRRELVLRTDPLSRLAFSHGRVEELTLMKAAAAAGVAVAEPLWHDGEGALLGRPFAVMRFLPGTADAPRIVDEPGLGGDKTQLAERLGRELAKIHSIRPPREDLAFLGPPPENAALADIARLRAVLDRLETAQPALEWALRWCERNAPPPGPVALVHGDYRTGNYLVGETGLTAILDWELCRWSEPLIDIGYFLLPYWRQSRPDLEAGGLAPKAAFLTAYEGAAGRRIGEEEMAYWQVMGYLHWAFLALNQGARYVEGGEPSSLDLALTARRRPPQVAFHLLQETPPARWGSP